MSYSFTTLLQLDHKFSLCSFICLSQYTFFFSSVTQAPRTVVWPFQSYSISQPHQPWPKGLLKFRVTKPLSLMTQICKFTAAPTCYNTKQPQRSPMKSLSLIKILQWAQAQRCAQLKHVVPTRTRAAESPRCILLSLLLPRRIPSSASQPSSNLRQLPCAVGLGRSLHGVTQSKMLTDFHTFPP